MRWKILVMTALPVAVTVTFAWQAFSSGTTTAGVLATLALLTSACLIFLVTRSISRQLGGELGDVQNYVATMTATGGECPAPGSLGTTGLAGALRARQTCLTVGVTSDDNLQDRQRIEIALGKVSANIMISDTDNIIVYANESTRQLFTDAEQEIRQKLHSFKADKLVGSSFDDFHSNPTHQRKLIAALRTTHSSSLKIGSANFKITANPIIDTDGERLGTVVEWADLAGQIILKERIGNVVEEILQGDLTRRVDTAGMEPLYREVGESINGIVEKLGNAMLEISRASVSVKDGSIEIAAGNDNLSQRTEQQAASLEETASSMTEMTSTVKQNAENALNANALAVQAREKAEKGGTVVSEAVIAMSEINTSSKKISDIIGVIDEIAFQTNLLALNASVEAARAGDQGRGFAVVASEVRNLAGRSATAAKEIKDLIHDSVQKVDAGTKLVNESGETLVEIVDGVKKVTDIVGEIAAASEEQSSGIEEVSRAIMQMEELTQQNAALVEEASAASSSLREQADDLTSVVGQYRIHQHGSKQSPGTERRATERPWSNTRAPAPPPISQATAGSRDVDWEEF